MEAQRMAYIEQKPVKNVELPGKDLMRHKSGTLWLLGMGQRAMATPENERASELARQGMAPYKPSGCT